MTVIYSIVESLYSEPDPPIILGTTELTISLPQNETSEGTQKAKAKKKPKTETKKKAKTLDITDMFRRQGEAGFKRQKVDKPTEAIVLD